MRVRWSTAAAQDLERIYDFIAQTSPEGARRVTTIILEGIGILTEFPRRGRPGRVEHTRELILAPFVAVYEVQEAVHVLRILHGAQRWP